MGALDFEYLLRYLMDVYLSLMDAGQRVMTFLSYNVELFGVNYPLSTLLWGSGITIFLTYTIAKWVVDIIS